MTPPGAQRQQNLVAMSSCRWEGLHTSASPFPLNATPPSELFHRGDADQAIATATAVIVALEQLDHPAQ